MVKPQDPRIVARYAPPINASALHPAWPILTSYTARALDRIALPLGGIGTGTVSLGGRGDLRDWEIGNRPAKGFNLQRTFTAIRAARPDGSDVFARCLEGPLLPPSYEGAHGSPASHAGLPRFAAATFHTAYPLAQIAFDDPASPVRVRLDAFNPLAPPNTDLSGLPVAILRYIVTNTSDHDLDVSIAGTLQNFVGNDGTSQLAGDNVNAKRQSDLVDGILLASDAVEPDAESWGTIALGMVNDDGLEITASEDWARYSWSNSLLGFWDDFVDDGLLDDHPSGSGPELPVASVAGNHRIAAGGEATFTLLIGWHFPNRQSWGQHRQPTVRVGNHYTTRFTDAWSVVEHVAANLDALERDTVDFIRAIVESPVPPVVREAALYNLSTLRSQTVFRIEDGTMMGWEGCNDRSGSCHGSCTHVWNYEQATPFLFAELARSMRDVEFLRATAPNGHMVFRANLPLDKAHDGSTAAADGQMGAIMKLHREWRLSGDDDWLARLWPHARRALEFCWIEGGWDADRDGVMEGCQHNTMDCEYYGPNPQMGFWYLGALKAAEQMAAHLGEQDFAATCADLFARGSAWLDEHLFNGEYYEHQIWPPKPGTPIARGLRIGGNDAPPPTDPDLQIGAGCLIDGLVGQYMANVTRLGTLGDPNHIRTTIQQTKRHNFRELLRDHFNHMRTYVVGDESAALMCSYPHGNRPARPFPYFTEVMTGFEYTLAALLIQEGFADDGLEIVASIRDRYDGERRSPFNEAECGHHYARAMASWACLLAISGFDFDARTGHLAIDDVEIGERMFWSNGSAWGTVERMSTDQHALRVHAGRIRLRSVAIGDMEQRTFDHEQIVETGTSLTI